MSYYYLMDTTQKESVDSQVLAGTPKSNIVGDKWILECTVSGLDCIVEYATSQDCINYIIETNEEWDELLNV